MSVTVVDPEDIKAALRKRHGTVGAFARSCGLKPQAVADWLRGRTSAPVANAVSAELTDVGGHGVQGLSIKLDYNAASRRSHRLNARGQ